MMENKKMRAEHPKRELAVDILYDIIGSILFGAGIYTFAEAGNFAPGGISGIALIMNKLWNLPVGTMTLILNIPLVIISYKTVGNVGTLFGISSLAKIDFYLIRVKFIRMLCNMFKQIQLIISFLQEFFNGFIQIFNILTTGA